MKEITRMKLVAALRKLGSRKRRHQSRYAVCDSVCHLTGTPMHYHEGYYWTIRRWKHYSGDSVYPVPPTMKGKSAMSQYIQAAGNGSFWKGKYGELRRQFARYLAQEYSKYREHKS